MISFKHILIGIIIQFALCQYGIAQSSAHWAITKRQILSFATDPPHIIEIPHRANSFEYSYYSAYSDIKGQFLALHRIRESSNQNDSGIVYFDSQFTVDTFFEIPELSIYITKDNGIDPLDLYNIICLNDSSIIENYGLKFRDSSYLANDSYFGILNNKYSNKLSYVKISDTSIYLEEEYILYRNKNTFWVLNQASNPQIDNVGPRYSPHLSVQNAHGKTIKTIYNPNDTSIYNYRSIAAVANKKSLIALHFYPLFKSNNDSFETGIQIIEIDEKGNEKLINSFLICKDKILDFDEYPRTRLGTSFSPNDSFLFVSVPYPNSVYHALNYNSLLLRYHIYNGTLDTILMPEKTAIYTMAPGPNGKLYFKHLYNGSWRLGVIHHPEQKGNDLDIEYDFVKKVTRGGFNTPNFFIDFVLPKYLNQHFVRFVAKPICSSNTLQLYNFSDSIYTKFKYELYSSDSVLLQEKAGYNAKLTINKTGNYLVKLIGETEQGYVNYRWQRVYFTAKPQVNFAYNDTVQCQYAQLNCQNLSNAKNTDSTSIQWQWQLFRNDTLVATKNNYAPKFSLNQIGRYSLKLRCHNGFCADSLQKNNILSIKKAPKSAFSISDSIICLPSKIVVKNTSNSEITSESYLWTDGEQFTSNQHNKKFAKNGTYSLTQTLYGPNGCSSKSSKTVVVRKGVLPKYIPNMRFATTADSSAVAVFWKKAPAANAYNLLKYDSLEQIIDSFYLKKLKLNYNDSLVSTQKSRYLYKIRAVDSCQKSSALSHFSASILLQAKNYNNSFLILNWNEYQFWPTDFDYEIEYFSNNKWQPLKTLADHIFKDSLLEKFDHYQAFYRVKALLNIDSNEISYSNVVKLSLKPSLFVPNAFSPNGDGINEIYKIGHFGISDFECKIFSSTGQQIVASNNPDAIWDGKSFYGSYPTGNYYLIIKATDLYGNELFYHDVISLLR